MNDCDKIVVKITETIEQVEVKVYEAEDGYNGWSPVFAVETDNARRVLRVVDWLGGEGTKPATGQYVGATGFVSLVSDAVDIRGPKGDQGEDLRASEKRHDFVSPYSYCGKALFGSSDDSEVWDIKRIQINNDGSTVITIATAVDWTNRLTHIYA